DVVAHDQVVTHGVVDPVIVVLPVAAVRTERAALLSGAEPADVVDAALLDDQVAGVGVDARARAGFVGADAADVVNVALRDRDIMGRCDRVVAAVGINARHAHPAHLEALDPDVVRPDGDADLVWMFVFPLVYLMNTH